MRAGSFKRRLFAGEPVAPSLLISLRTHIAAIVNVIARATCGQAPARRGQIHRAGYIKIFQYRGSRTAELENRLSRKKSQQAVGICPQRGATTIYALGDRARFD